MYLDVFSLLRVGVFSLLTCMTTMTSSSNGEVKCGIQKIVKKVNENARIVNGVASYPGEWPWQVMVLHNGFHICGGTLIYNQWVMTAAHCIIGNVESHSKVILGATKKDLSDSSVVKATIGSIHCHDKYVDDNTYKDDICLVKLTTPVQYNDYIIPACLPSKKTIAEDGRTCTVTGWGETQDPENLADVLQKANVKIINRQLCETWYSTDFVTIPEKHLCAGHEAGGTDSCQGDSGGPLVCLETTTSASNAYVVRGITSFGIGCALKQRPGIYTKVVNFVEWIENTTGIKTQQEKKIEVTTAQDTVTRERTTLSLILVPQNCGGLIKSRITVMSNMSEGNYATTNCTWNIEAPKEYWILLTNIQFFLPDDKNSCRDLIQIILYDYDVSHINCTKKSNDIYEIWSNKATLHFIKNDNENQSSNGVTFTVEFTPTRTTTTTKNKRELKLFSTGQPNTSTSGASNTHFQYLLPFSLTVLFFTFGKNFLVLMTTLVT